MIKRHILASLRAYVALFCVSALVIAVSFWIFPSAFFDPLNTGWITDSGDFEQHYIGWQFFRKTPILQYPLFKIPNYGIVDSNSIIYTDSIPLFALIAKALPIHSDIEFQYFGIYVGLSMVLSALFAGRYLRLSNIKLSISIPLSLLIAINPVLLSRATGHTALTSQWLIICALILARSKHNKFGFWFLLLQAALLIHLYLFVMVAALFSASYADKLFRKVIKLRVRDFLSIAAIVVVLIPSLYIYGYAPFLPSNATASGYGVFATNLLSPFNPVGIYSSILPALPSHYGSNEGLAFPGIALLFLNVPVWLIKSVRSRFLELNFRQPILLCTCFLLALFSITPVIHFGALTVDLGRLPYPFFILGDIFRASGRFIWPFFYFYYLNLLVAFGSHLQEIKYPRARFLVLILLITIAVFDLREFRALRHARLNTERSTTSSHVQLIGNLPPTVDPSRLISILFYPNKEEPNGWNNLARAALSLNIPTNGTSLARYNRKKISMQNQSLERIILNEPRVDTLYVITDDLTYHDLKDIHPQCAHIDIDTKRELQRPTHCVDIVDGLKMLLPVNKPLNHS